MIGVRWGWEGTRGELRQRPVKSPAYAYPGSNPGPATPYLTCGNAVSARPLTPLTRAGIRSDFAPPDAVRTPTAPSGASGPSTPVDQAGLETSRIAVRPLGQPWMVGARVA